MLPSHTEPSKANIILTFQGGTLRVQCHICPNTPNDWLCSAELPFDRASLASRIQRIADLLPYDQAGMWMVVDDPLSAPEDNEELMGEFWRCMECVYTEGSQLYRELHKNGLSEILDRLEVLPDGSILTIYHDGTFFPWEILYPYKYHVDWEDQEKEEKPLRYASIWGYRFRSCYNLMPTLDPNLYSKHVESPQFISLNVNPTIEKLFEKHPFRPIEFHKNFQSKLYDCCINSEIRDKGREIVNLLMSGDCRATIIYLYCHGTSSNPFGPKSIESIEVDAGVTIDPAYLANDKTYSCAPLIIMNSCVSGIQSPLSFSSFLEVFREKHAIGMLGTTAKMPATFAACFGCKLIKEYLSGSLIGDVLFSLRRELLDQRIPLGLLYTLQCPIYLKTSNKLASDFD